MSGKHELPIGRGFVVDRLVADLAPVRPRRMGNDFIALAVLAGLEIGLVAVNFEPRPDMPTAMRGMMFWWKLASCLALALGGTAALVVALSPDAGRRAGHRTLIGVAAMVVFVALALIVVRPPDFGMMMLTWREGLACIAMIEVFALPLMVGAMVVARHAAPAYPRGTVLAASLASSGWGAVAFNWRCPHDEPMYVLVWFGSAVVLNAVVALLILPRWLRW